MEITFLFIAYTPISKKFSTIKTKYYHSAQFFSVDDHSRAFSLNFSTRMLLHIIKNKNHRIVEIDANESLYCKTLHNDKKNHLSLWRVYLILFNHSHA